jgi:hypothetical protein
LTLVLYRSGGCIITARLDIWTATKTEWVLAASKVFQDVANPHEVQTAGLQPGLYTAVLTTRAEESINGVFSLQFDVNGATVAKKSGDVNTTSDPHDSVGFKSQFVLVIH